MRTLTSSLLVAMALFAAAPAQAQVSIDWPGDIPFPEVPGGSASDYSCSDQLGHLRRVREEELTRVDDPHEVWVTTICADDHMMRSDGNVGTLRQIIASNDAMTEALWHKSYRSEDVVGIRMTGPHTVLLYVYRFRD